MFINRELERRPESKSLLIRCWHNEGTSKAVLTIEFQNAFNMVSREALLLLAKKLLPDCYEFTKLFYTAVNFSAWLLQKWWYSQQSNHLHRSLLSLLTKIFSIHNVRSSTQSARMLSLTVGLRNTENSAPRSIHRRDAEHPSAHLEGSPHRFETPLSTM